MYQSRKLRSQSPAPAEDRELRVLPFRGISEPTLESLLNELVQRLQAAIRIENSAGPHPSEEPQSPLPILSNLSPHATPESPRGEAGLNGEGRDVLPDAAFESLLKELVQRSQEAF